MSRWERRGGEHLGRGFAGGADDEHVAEAVLVGAIAFGQRREIGGGCRTRLDGAMRRGVLLSRPECPKTVPGDEWPDFRRPLAGFQQIRPVPAPHLIDAKKQVVEAGLLGKIGHVDLCCYFHMRANGNPPVEPVPDFLDYEMWTGPAPLRPYDGLPHKRWWRTFTEYGNGIVGDMCVHMLDTARWMLGLGWPKRITSAGGIYVQKEGKSNISDTQTATFEYDHFNCVWQHRTWGTPPDPDYPWALFIYGEKGTLKASTMRADFVPLDKDAKPLHFECVYEKEKYPEDVTEKDIELNAAPATRRHMLDFLAAIEKRSRPIADIEEGHISTASCILANVAREIGRPVVYDPKRRVVVGDSEATKVLRRPYRAPWKHPGVA